MVYKGCDSEYASQVTSEHKVLERSANGTKRMKWKKKQSHGDNHYLDCEVYAMAAAEILGVRRLHLQGKEDGEAEPEALPAKEPETPEEEWLREKEWL